MLNHFCTLFNSAYLSRGLALYRSLLKNAKDFHLTIFAFDDAAYEILTALKLDKVTVIPLSELERAFPALLQVKEQRSIGEYCWTCTPATIAYCLDELQYPSACYCDADIYFWRDPAELLNLRQEESVLLTLHRFSPQYDKSVEAGQYCVQFMYFKNDIQGRTALYWWRDACIEWCYDRVEPGRFGDQKYLDDWTTRFKGVTVLSHLGGGVAPWNVQQYQWIRNSANEKPVLQEIKTGITFDLVFYHFHALKFVNHKADLGCYQLTSDQIKVIYKPYVDMLLAVEKALQQDQRISSLLKNINLHGRVQRSPTWKERLKQYKKQLLGQCYQLNLE